LLLLLELCLLMVDDFFESDVGNGRCLQLLLLLLLLLPPELRPELFLAFAFRRSPSDHDRCLTVGEFLKNSLKPC
jgi:hypothetical protein